MDLSHSPASAANQLRDQLSSEKRKLSFLFGAGTSMTVGIPGVIELTRKINDAIDDKFKDTFATFRVQCNSDNIETILNDLRTLRELIKDDENKEYNGIKGKTFVQQFDMNICKSITSLVVSSPILVPGRIRVF